MKTMKVDPCPECHERDCGGAPRFKGLSLDEKIVLREREAQQRGDASVAPVPDVMTAQGTRDWGCKRLDCGTSTGICDSLTFGRGKLDNYGYWSEPCFECARAFELLHPEDAPCWPHVEPPKRKCPSWTIHYNRVNPGSRWIGTGWEFFDEESAAKARYDELMKDGHYPTKRPYHAEDKRHLGAVHAMNGEG